MPDATSIAAKPKRRWYQYSLRTLFVFVTLICVACGMWLGPKIHRHKAVVAIEQADWRITYADVPDNESWLFRTLRAYLPRDYFDDVVKVEFLCVPEKELRDSDLAELKFLTGLRMLRIEGNKITDAQLVHLKGLISLEQLYLYYNSPLTEAGLVHLRGLTELKVLYLGCTSITDAGLAELGELSGLEQVALFDTHVPDSGLVHLRKLTGLKWLFLDGTEVTEACVAELQTALPNCNIHLSI